MQLPVSAILITKNEERNIFRCLSSLSFAQEIILVDSGSSDKTVEIARTFANVRIVDAPWFGFAKNKQIAVDHAQNSWIFWIDADEEVTTELQHGMHAALANPSPDTAGFLMPRKTFFLGSWVKHSGWYPGYVLRLFDKNRASLNDNELHEGVIPYSGFKTEKINQDILHYSYTSLYQYFDKMNRYGKAGAVQLQKRNKKFFWPFILFQPLWTFFKFYILKRGFLDGYIGIIVCMGAAFSNFIKYTNFLFLEKYGFVDSTEDNNAPRKK